MHASAVAAHTRFTAIVPAHNEQATIAGVVEPLLAHALIDEVIVVDDGSTDGTGAIARAAGARVITQNDNAGKAAAMERGVAAARNDLIFFCDADVTGLTSEGISRVLTPVLLRDYGMFVGIRARRIYWMNRILHFTPIIGGERALSRSLWKQVPPGYKKNFQIEIALNFFAKMNGHRMGFTIVEGLGQVIKERKRGLLRGLGQRLAMIGDILLVSWRIYIVLQAQQLLERRPAEPSAT